MNQDQAREMLELLRMIAAAVGALDKRDAARTGHNHNRRKSVRDAKRLAAPASSSTSLPAQDRPDGAAYG